MPKQKISVSNEMLQSAGVYELDPGTRLIAAQAGMLLGRSKTRMDSDRRDSKPPPAYKDGGKVIYPLGSVLAERARQEGKTMAELEKEREDHIRGWSKATFSGFIATAGIRDVWPIALLDGVPVDALTSLGEEVTEILPMTLGEYLGARLEAAVTRDRREQEKVLQGAIAQAPVDAPTGRTRP